MATRPPYLLDALSDEELRPPISTNELAKDDLAVGFKDKQCPHCESIVDRLAKVCGRCGYDFITKQRAPLTEEEEEKLREDEELRQLRETIAAVNPLVGFFVGAGDPDAWKSRQARLTITTISYVGAVPLSIILLLALGRSGSGPQGAHQEMDGPIIALFAIVCPMMLVFPIALNWAGHMRFGGFSDLARHVPGVLGTAGRMLGGTMIAAVTGGMAGDPDVGTAIGASWLASQEDESPGFQGLPISNWRKRRRRTGRVVRLGLVPTFLLSVDICCAILLALAAFASVARDRSAQPERVTQDAPQQVVNQGSIGADGQVAVLTCACGKKFGVRLTERTKGKTAACPDCGALLTVPDAVH